jgi:23S rRNA (cytosine1962-C5)-methyltransferase
MGGYELLDAGGGRRLERFGDRVVDRPAPSVEGVPARAGGDGWAAADLRFDREAGWIGANVDPWQIRLDDITVELRPTSAGQVGLFPEHLLAWPWLRDQTSANTEVLHLFAHTGATTLALAAGGARVTHVDASRPAVRWARRNAEHSRLMDRPIRWIVDDALTYTRREARRGHRYAGVILDPPSFGHGPGGMRWELETSLQALLEACAAVVAWDAFVLLTAHTESLTPEACSAAIRAAFGSNVVVDAGPLELRATSGAVLPLGVAARMIRR